MINSDLEFKELDISDLNPSCLDKYNRYQEVSKVWRKVNGKPEIKELCFTEEWNADKKSEIICELVDILLKNGHVFGAYDGKDLIGFSAVGGSYLDEDDKYIQLVQLQVSYEYRGRRIGEDLFRCCTEQARDHGAEKLYISGHSAVESQAFYTRVGCVEAEWICTELVDLEPYDCQLEYIIR